MGEVLRPLFDRIVVKELDHTEEQLKSGLLVPVTRHEAQRPPQFGIVVAARPGIDWWGAASVEMPVKVGDKVAFAYNVGTYLTVEEEDLLVMHVGQVLGVVEDVPARAE
jgi:co-chaperonin GroES (HSP10)